MSDGAVGDGVEAGASRALVTVASPLPATSRGGLGLPAFLAQLIACHRRLPDYRRARRGAPAQVATAYGPTRKHPAPGLDVTV